MTQKANEFVEQFHNVSCKNVIDGYVSENHIQTEIPMEIRVELFELFKKFVAQKSRAKRKKRILDSDYSTINNCGILSRLWVDKEHNDVFYCCGQEWDSEMQTLREVFAGDI